MSRIFITGVGAVTPFGDVATTFERWLAGEHAIVEGQATCQDFDPLDWMTRQEARRSDRFTQLALAAAQQAMDDAGWSAGLPEAAERVGCVIATGVGGLQTTEAEIEAFRTRGPSRLSPLGLVRLMPNAAAASVAMRHGLRGESFGLNGACASGGQAIGAGLRMLQSGEADAMLVGGSDAEGTQMQLAAFKVMRASTKSGVSRPFDRRRDGFIPSEGAAVLLLEREEVVAARGATVLGELLSYGASTDAHSLISPHPEGRGAVDAMRMALGRAALEPGQVDYINAHGTSTAQNDKVEAMAISEVFGAEAPRIPISTSKSAIGHLSGAAGSVEAILTLFALRRGVAPPTVGFEEPDDGVDLDFVPGTARPLRRAHDAARLIGLSNSFGLGGHNSAVVIGAEPSLV